jgi:hypothetical protein
MDCGRCFPGVDLANDTWREDRQSGSGHGGKLFGVVGCILPDTEYVYARDPPDFDHSDAKNNVHAAYPRIGPSLLCSSLNVEFQMSITWILVRCHMLP